jgi:hypothetical protein
MKVVFKHSFFPPVLGIKNIEKCRKKRKNMRQRQKGSRKRFQTHPNGSEKAIVTLLIFVQK